MDRPDLDAIEGRLRDIPTCPLYRATAGGLLTYARALETILDGIQRITPGHGWIVDEQRRGVVPYPDMVRAISTEMEALRAERDRLALTLRCERGGWAPEGWAANPERPTQWGHAKQNLACYRIARGLWVVVRRGRLGPPVAEAPTALEAIEAADAALREVAGG